VKPDGDKLRRANAWSPLVEDRTVLFGPGQKELIDAMLAVPGDDPVGPCRRRRHLRARLPEDAA
jgi:phage terminase large subunit-like protein